MDCGPLEAPEDGTVATPDGTTEGATANYSCESGYGIVGAASRTCDEDGAWTGSAPTCAIGDCASLESPSDGLVTTLSGTTYGATATYSCNTGHDLVGDAERMCLADKTWSGAAPTCAIRNCGALTAPSFGTVQTPSGTTYGATATYSCNTGYGLVGAAERMCLADKTWSGAAPTCAIRNCGALTAPSFGMVQTPSGTTYGATATYACSMGYTLSGSATRTCAENGSWSGSAPTCAVVDECAAGTHGCAPGGSCTMGAGYGYSCTCTRGYASSGGSFPSCNGVPILEGDRTTIAFPAREHNTTSGATNWVIRNDGAAATGALTFSNSNAGDFDVTNGCTSSLAPGASCTIGVRFAPKSYGPRTGTLQIGNAAAGSLTLDVSGNSQARLTVAAAGTGTGTITGPGGINCGSTCSALFDYGANVSLRANTSNGSNSVLSGWSSSACSGPARDCTVTVVGSTTVSATFTSLTHNLIFVTSQSLATNLGSATAYDTRCNQLATAAGINNSAGNGYIAAMSDNASTFSSRLGANVRGWVRLDGRPVGNTMAQMLARTVYHPVTFDELGRKVDAHSWSGTNHEGGSTYNCNNWTSSSSTVYGSLGHSLKGPSSWIWSLTATCETARPVMCLGNTRTTTLTPATTTGKRIWASSNYRGGAVSPDQRCFADRPSGVSNAVALVGFTNRTAASRLSPTANYVRPDGQLVGTGQQIIDRNIITGIWQLGNGAYYDDFFAQNWCGAESLTALGTPNSTCNNWTDASGSYSGYVGDLDTTSLRFWWTFGSVTCDAFGDPNRVLRLYCVEP